MDWVQNASCPPLPAAAEGVLAARFEQEETVGDNIGVMRTAQREDFSDAQLLSVVLQAAAPAYTVSGLARH